MSRSTSTKLYYNTNLTKLKMRREIERRNELYVARDIVKNSFIEVLM